MATLAHSQPSRHPAPADLAAQVRAHLLEQDSMQIWEGGRLIARLGGDHTGYSLTTDAGHLICHFWSPEANLVRRVISATPGRAGHLHLQCLRFGHSQPTSLVLAGAAAAETPDILDRRRRQAFRQEVIAVAEREWHGWTFAPCSPEPAFHKSGIQRFLFRRQQRLIPCVAVHEQESNRAVSTALSFALLWAHAVRKRFPDCAVAAIRLILPSQGIDSLRLRRRGLRSAPVIECFDLDRSAGQFNPVPLSEEDDLASTLRRAPSTSTLTPAGAAGAILAEIREFCPQATWGYDSNGKGGARFYGLEILRESFGAEALVAPYCFGAGSEQSPLLPATRPLFHRFLRDLASQRVAGGDRRHPLYAVQPERWMEHLLRCDPTCLDAQVDPRFVYAQVPLCRHGHRDVLDLLALDRTGRLLVWELKADEDVDFPLQALDYWLGVRHHQLLGDFSKLGYFPGISISPLPPRLWLVAPALRWHPQTDILTRWISPEIPWTRCGLNEEWRHGLQIVSRKDSVPS